MSIDEIIAALEAATGPSRELDLAIANAIGHAVLIHNDEHTAHGFTASIDAALTLVPKGWTWKVLSYSSGKNFGAVLEDDMSNEVDHQVYPAPPTPALALCIAALRARQVQS